MNDMPEIHAILSQNFPVLESWFIERMLNLFSQPETDRYQLLLAARDFEITSYSVRRELRKVESVVDLPETQRTRVVGSYLRQVVLMQYDLARDERRRWFTYWLDEKNFSGENIVTVAYIISLAAESQDLISESSRDYVAKWHVRHDNLKAPKSRAWAPRALALFGHTELARDRAEKILSEREINGSWQGGYGNTAAIAYALLRSGVVGADEFTETAKYLVRRLERGVTGDTALESMTLKFLKLAGLMTQQQEAHLVRSVNRDRSVFLSHSSDDHPFVQRLGQVLTDFGVRVWVDTSEISGGDSFIDKIEEGLTNMQHLVVVLSSNSVNSFWVKRELNYALVDKVESQQGKVIPVLLETCEIPALIRERHYVDFREDFDRGVHELLRAIEVDNT